MRIEAVADRAGLPDRVQRRPGRHSEFALPRRDPCRPTRRHRSKPNRPLNIVDVEMTPPAGRERLFAVWTRQPLSLRLDQLHSLVEPRERGFPASRPYVATRDMKRVQQSVQQLRPEDWHAVVLELDHGP